MEKTMVNELVLYAAGSLRGALSEVVAAFTHRYDVPVRTVYGPSGTLREQLEDGEHADVFASADMGHPMRLTNANRSGPVALFARNRVCALVAPGISITTGTLLDRLLDPAVTLAASTPITDPLGDYTWEIFRRADVARPGSFDTLTAKARRLGGGGSLPPIPAGQNPLAYMLLDGKLADVFLAYGSMCQEIVLAAPTLQVVELPAELTVKPAFGLTVLAQAPLEAATLALFILSPDGQTILARHGFVDPLLPPSPAGS
jgi:molybdate transport system substrate-binding protein